VTLGLLFLTHTLTSPCLGREPKARVATKERKRVMAKGEKEIVEGKEIWQRGESDIKGEKTMVEGKEVL
jgi:hypothetical protein